MQSGVVGVLGAIAPKPVATEPAFAQERVLQKASCHFQSPVLCRKTATNKQLFPVEMSRSENLGASTINFPLVFIYYL